MYYEVSLVKITHGAWKSVCVCVCVCVCAHACGYIFVLKSLVFWLTELNESEKITFEINKWLTVFLEED